MLVPEQEPRYDVFISYRRGTSDELARLLQRELKGHGVLAFLDRDLTSGVFDDKLLHRIAETPAFLVILPPEALNRCSNEEDWLRKEIVEAMSSDRNIIPLLVDSFQFTAEMVRKLDPSVQGLSRYQAVEYSRTYFDSTIERIMKIVEVDKAVVWFFRGKGSLWTIGLLGVLLFLMFLLRFTGRPSLVFPQFGRGIFWTNTANTVMAKESFRACEGRCLEGIKTALSLDANLNNRGYADVAFHKVFFPRVDLGKQILLRAAITTENQNFEIGMSDGPSAIFFNCRAQQIGRANDFVVDLSDEHLSKEKEPFNPRDTLYFAIGFTNDAGSGTGRHHMDVYGILSGDVVRKTSDTVACALRGAHTQQVERLDHLFGNGNWFVYPDSNYQQIGVKRLARGFFVDGVNVEWVQTCQRKVQAGHTSPGDCGATVGLKSALQESDIPLWQRGAIQEWKKAASKSSTQGITVSQVTEIFGNSRWYMDRTHDFAAIGVADHAIPIEYPITNID